MNTAILNHSDQANLSTGSLTFRTRCDQSKFCCFCKSGFRLNLANLGVCRHAERALSEAAFVRRAWI